MIEICQIFVEVIEIIAYLIKKRKDYCKITSDGQVREVVLDFSQ